MALSYKIWLAPWLYERLFVYAQHTGAGSIKEAIKSLVADPTESTESKAMDLLRQMEGWKNGDHPVQHPE